MNTLKKLNYLYDKKTKLSFLGILVLIIIGSLIEMIGVVIVLPVINLALDVEFENNFIINFITKITGVTNKEEILLLLVGTTIIVYIFKAAYLSWMNAVVYTYSANLRRAMSAQLMGAYLVQPYGFFLKKDSSEFIRSINVDTGNLQDVVTNALLVASNGLTAIVLLVAMVVVNPQMSIFLAILLSLCAIIIVLCVQKRTRRLGRENQIAQSDIIKYLQQSFEGIKEIKILGNESFFLGKFNYAFKRYADIMYKTKLLNVVPKYMIEAVSIIGIMVYLEWNIKFNPNYLAIIPQLATFVTAAYKLLPAVNGVYAYSNVIVYHRASIDLVYNEVKEANELEYKDCTLNDEIEEFKFNEKITFENVTFSYDNSEKKVLNKVNFEIPKGKSIALIGPSGGGKTTTADIGIGILTPQEGRILVDGVDIGTNIEGWRRQIGYIPQTIYLIDDSIASNIALGVPKDKIDIERVNKALESAQLTEMVNGLEKGIDTVIGERGNRLSGGQRQRIGIARALYRDPEVLVFDEATSALDNDTEKEVMKAIDSLHGNKTMIMIAHRLSTIENCDMVYKVENGEIVFNGKA